MLSRCLLLTVPIAGFLMGSLALADDDSSTQPVYELRTYYTAPGKLDVLLKRFAETNLGLFEKHGIKLVGAWTPAVKDEQGDRLVYIVSFPSRDAAKTAWAAFSDDPDWKAVFGKEKETNGDVVIRGESIFLKRTDYSPKATHTGEGCVFELRTYTASPGKIDDLHKRFREHTIALFEKHGIESLGYAVPLDADKGAGSTLVYMLAFPSKDAADAAWKAFRDDPEWQKVKTDSEADGTPLASKVVSVFLKPTDFSPVK